MHFYAIRKRNKRKSRDSEGELVLKYHFEHPKINGALVKAVWEVKVGPHLQEHGIKLVVMDNDCKFHTKGLVQMMENKFGVQVYPGSGTRPWVSWLLF